MVLVLGSRPRVRRLGALAIVVIIVALVAVTATRGSDPGSAAVAPPPATGTRAAPVSETPGTARPTAPDTRRPAQPIEPYRGAGAKVAVIGDSITFVARDEIRAALTSGGFAPSVAGLYGYTATGAAPTALSYVATAPDIVVVELGTNDATELAYPASTATPATYRDAMRRITEAFPGACVAVTTVTTDRTKSALHFRADAWNAAARGIDDWLRTTYPNVIDWQSAIHHDGLAGTPLVQDDEVHPDPRGAAVLAQLDVDAAEHCAAQRESGPAVTSP